MADKIITLTEVKIKSIVINYENQSVEVNYAVVDANDGEWIHGKAVFWVTLPANPPLAIGGAIYGNYPYPDVWFQLPASYIPTLVGLRDDAKAVLENKFLGGA